MIYFLFKKLFTKNILVSKLKIKIYITYLQPLKRQVTVTVR
jgi:hypothetical protein